MHAAGVVISDISLDEVMPLYKVGDTVLTGYSMEYIEYSSDVHLYFEIDDANDILDITK